MEQIKQKTLAEIMNQYKDQKPKRFGHDDLTERCYPVSAIIDIVKEHSDQKVANLEAQNKELLSLIKYLLPMAKDGYKRCVSNGSHQDFLEDDRAILSRAEQALKEDKQDG